MNLIITVDSQHCSSALRYVALPTNISVYVFHKGSKSLISFLLPSTRSTAFPAKKKLEQRPQYLSNQRWNEACQIAQSNQQMRHIHKAF